MVSGMVLAPDPLPKDIAGLHGIIAAQRGELVAAKTEIRSREAEVKSQAAEIRSRDVLIEKLRAQLAWMRRQRHGRSSEKLDGQIAQLELALEEIEAVAASEAPEAIEPIAKERRSRGRKPLLKDLPRERVVHEAPETCPDCGGAMRRFAEDVSEVLEFVPARFKVIQHVRPKLSCRICERIVQAEAPSLPIPGGFAGPSLLAHVLVSKFADHLPLYRQSVIYERGGVALSRSTLADWVGKSAGLLAPLVECLRKEVLSAAKLHGDDTPVPVLDPGRGRTKTGRLWVYVRDGRPRRGAAPPGAVYFYSPDRKGEHPKRHLAKFKGTLQADGYAGFNELYAARANGKADVVEAACWAHARRKFHDIHVAGSSPIAEEALRRIGELYSIEDDIRGQAAEDRRAARQARSKPLVNDLQRWFKAQTRLLPRKARLAGGDPLCLGALAGAQPLSPRRHHRDRQQRRACR